VQLSMSFQTSPEACPGAVALWATLDPTNQAAILALLARWIAQHSLARRPQEPAVDHEESGHE
jgi:hypothetical protein